MTQDPLAGRPPVVADPARRWGEPGFPRHIQDGELTAVWKLRGATLIRLFGWAVLEAQPVPGSELPGVRHVLREMLSIRLMTAEEHREMRRRVDLLSQHGRDAIVIGHALIQRAHRAIRAPFWFPALMTNEELVQHLTLSSDVAAPPRGLRISQAELVLA